MSGVDAYCKTWASALLAEAILMLHLFETQTVQGFEAKQSVVILHDQVTHPLLDKKWGTYLKNRTFRIFRNGRIDCRDAFYSALRL